MVVKELLRVFLDSRMSQTITYFMKRIKFKLQQNLFLSNKESDEGGKHKG